MWRFVVSNVLYIGSIPTDNTFHAAKIAMGVIFASMTTKIQDYPRVFRISKADVRSPGERVCPGSAGSLSCVSGSIQSGIDIKDVELQYLTGQMNLRSCTLGRA
jgi:hypothetical protein